MSLPAILLVYVLIQGVAYTFVLKHMVLLDIGTIAGGFVLRAIAGAAVLDIAVTPWLLVCVGLLALFLGVGKRRAELVMLGDGASAHRSILKQYSLPMLDQMLAITTTATLIAYTLFTISAPTLPHLPYPTMLATVPFVFYAVFRYLYLVYQRNEGGSPEEIVIKDHPLALTIVLWGVTVLAGLVLT